MRTLSFLLCVALAGPVAAQDGADIAVLGEVHDNPLHHAEQARLVAELAPKAIVWEMLPGELPPGVEGVDRTDAEALGKALGWAESGWPDFAMYAPIFAAAPDAMIIGGAATKEDLARARAEGAAVVFGDAAELYGLTTPLENAEFSREEMIRAHCNALPAEVAGQMVEAQRLKDAHMARLALDALDLFGPPVVVITGTGHARNDTGIPAAIRSARPVAKVWSLGQTEFDPGPDAPYDAVNVTEAAPREDPCAAFAVE